MVRGSVCGSSSLCDPQYKAMLPGGLMTVLQRIDGSLISLLLLLFLLADARKARNSVLRASSYFMAILYTTMIPLTLEALSWVFDGQPGSGMYVGNWLSNTLLYAFDLLPLSLWMAYLDECIVCDAREKRIKLWIYAGINLITLGMAVTNPWTGFLFTISAENLYVRGPGVVVIMLLNYGLLAGNTAALLRYRRFITGRIYPVILALGVLPVLGAALQISFYGTLFIWPMMSLVALAGYLLIEREELRRDPLTALLTRPSLEYRIKSMINRRFPFSLIMVDLDKFKDINDTYGHEEGDDTLRIVGNMLAKSIKHGDTVYRVGGDEFMLMIESSDADAALHVATRLNASLSRFNDSGTKSYPIAISIGSARYDGIGDVDLSTLYNAADEQMYRNKKAKQSATPIEPIPL